MPPQSCLMEKKPPGLLSRFQSFLVFILDKAAPLKYRFWLNEEEKRETRILKGLPFSAAQQCDTDTLAVILAYVSQVDVARAASVCRDWTTAARRVLYTNLRFRCLSDGASALASTLIGSAIIRSLVRHLVIEHYTLTQRWVDRTVDWSWLLLLPARGIESITITQMQPQRSFSECLVHSPALYSVRRVTILGQHLSLGGAALRNYAALPALEHLSLKITGIINDTFKRRDVSRLKRLSVVADQDRDELVSLLRFVGGSLTRLDIRLDSWQNAAALQHPLSMLSNLRSLSLDVRQYEPVPILDTVAPLLVQLESLYCGYGTYSDALFPVIPARLETLQLRGSPFYRTHFAVEGALEMIERARVGALSLKKLVIHHVGDVAAVRRLKIACNDAGIAFTFVKVSYVVKSKKEILAEISV